MEMAVCVIPSAPYLGGYEARVHCEKPLIPVQLRPHWNVKISDLNLPTISRGSR